MPRSTGTRVLYLDDSGNPSQNHESKAVVIGGFSIPSENVPALYRKVAGAKGHFYPRRGDPGKWEVKATETIKPNQWKRSKNRNFIEEIARILGSLGCTVYAVSINKSNMNHPMALTTTVPLQLQALVEHFAVECAEHQETGVIVSDWSNHRLDAHASRCVATFVLSRCLPMHPSVYYANSQSSHAIQIADLVAGIRRRSMERDANLQPIDDIFAGIRTLSSNAAARTHSGRPFANRIPLF